MVAYAGPIDGILAAHAMCYPRTSTYGAFAFRYSVLALASLTIMDTLADVQSRATECCADVSRTRALFMLVIALIAAVVVAGGCQSTGTSYRVLPESIADQFLPRERIAQAHPDSMRLLTITERDDKIAFEMEQSYQHLHRLWSSTFNVVSTGRSPTRPLTYATLWSQELSLASLEAREGITTLTKEAAREQIAKEREIYRTTVQVDLYWFSRSGQTPPTLLRSNVRLHTIGSEEERYHPQEIRHLPVRDAVLSSGASVLYRRTIFVFNRVVDERDILAGTNGLQLRILTPGSSRLQFAWSWPNEGSESAAQR